jgi:ferritin-like metal-binding protein YciE
MYSLKENALNTLNSLTTRGQNRKYKDKILNHKSNTKATQNTIENT